MIVRTRIQWHIEKDGVFTWHEPGEIADVTVEDLDNLILIGTVEPLSEKEADAWLAAQKKEEVPPTKPTKRSAPSAPESES